MFAPALKLCPGSGPPWRSSGQWDFLSGGAESTGIPPPLPPCLSYSQVSGRPGSAAGWEAELAMAGALPALPLHPQSPQHSMAVRLARRRSAQTKSWP